MTTLLSLLTITAIIAGPILAVQIQKLIERLTKRKQAKEAIFKVLMSTRGARLSPDHVRALNMIDLEFYGRKKKNKRVVHAWRFYLDQLATCPKDTQAPDYKVKLETWSDKSIDVFNNMLFEMANSLGYDFDKVLLKRGAYFPTGYGETEAQLSIINRSLSEIFLGLKSIPIHIVKPTQVTEPESLKEDAQHEITDNNPPIGKS